MLFGTRVPRRLSFLVIALSVALMQRASADSTAQTLPFSQDWSNTALLNVERQLVSVGGDAPAAQSAWRSGRSQDSVVSR